MKIILILLELEILKEKYFPGHPLQVYAASFADFFTGADDIPKSEAQEIR